MGLWRWLVAAVLVVGGLTACTGVADQTREAKQVEAEVRALPGVVEVSSYYVNNITHGVIFELTIRMGDATEEQIADVVRRLPEITGDDFEGHELPVTFSVVGGMLRYPGQLPAPEVVAEDARKLRLAGPRIDALVVTLSRAADWMKVEVDRSPKPFEALGVVQEVFGADSGSVTLKHTFDEAVPDFVDSTLPLTADQYRRIRAQVDSAPGLISQAAITDGALSELNVDVPDPATAYDELTALIGRIGASPQHPLVLRYSWADNPKRREGVLRFFGSVEVGSCVYRNDTGNDGMTPLAVDVEQRLRAEYSTC